MNELKKALTTLNQSTVDTFNRVEKKFLLTQAQYVEIVKILSTRMIMDVFTGSEGIYHVLSLYYDTPHNDLISTALSKPKYREKLRLRTYLTPQLDTPVFIEIKKKINSMSNKRRDVLPLMEAYQFLESGKLPNPSIKDNSQVLREIYAMLCRYDINLHPSALLSYDRMAFTGRKDCGLRISFDTNIRWRTQDLRLEFGGDGERLLDSDLVIMEIKTLYCMPLWLTHLLASQRLFPSSFSKYGTVYLNELARNLKEKIIC